MNQRIAPLFIAFAAFLWSLDALLRTSLYSLPPAIIVFWEHLLAAIVLSPLFYIKRHEIKKLTRKEWTAIILVALFSGALGTILYTAALGKINYIQFSIVPLLQQTQPIWAIVAAAIVLKEKVRKNFVLWAGLAITATYMITFKDLRVNFGNDLPTIQAAGMALGAAIMWGVSTSFSKVVLSKVSFWTSALLRFSLAPLFALVFVFLFGHQDQLFAINTNQWLMLLAITFSTGGLALVIYYYGLRSTPARVSTIVELTWPASAVLMGYFIFKDVLSMTQIIGIGILLIAMYQVSTKHRS